MGLEDRAAVKRVADEHGSEVVVLLGDNAILAGLREAARSGHDGMRRYCGSLALDD